MGYARFGTDTFVGFDVHRASISGAILVGSGEVIEGRFSNTVKGRQKLRRWLDKHSEGQVFTCYEAGPCGYGLQRELVAAGYHCSVVAPSKTPQKPGDRVKTDRRDAKKLAVMLRGGLLAEVHPPTVEEEGVRDLCRCREDARLDLHRARQRILKFLDRHDLKTEHNNWTDKHRGWLRGLKIAQEHSRRTFEQYLFRLDQAESHLREMDREVEELSREEPHEAGVSALCCFRGLDRLSAMILVSELYAIGRFADPRSLMGFLGLTPSEDSSGERERKGGITKAGNGLVRRILTEASWHSWRRPCVSKALKKRREGQPWSVIAVADRAMGRLHGKYWRLVHGGKDTRKAVTAVARELVGFVWAALREVESSQST